MSHALVEKKLAEVKAKLVLGAVRKEQEEVDKRRNEKISEHIKGRESLRRWMFFLPRLCRESIIKDPWYYDLPWQRTFSFEDEKLCCQVLLLAEAAAGELISLSPEHLEAIRWAS